MLKTQIRQRGSKGHRRSRTLRAAVRLRWLDVAHWWHGYDHRYGFKWRLVNGTAAVLLIVAVVIPVAQQIANARSYELSAEALKLVGSTDPTLVKQLTYDAQTSTYQFNKDGVKASDSAASMLASMKSQVGTASGQGKDKSLYALDVPTDFSKGVTYHDTNSQLSFSLVPQFKALQGKDVDGHVVFPLSGDTQAIYTLKNNGLKEDIVVPKATSDTMTFSYMLNLPNTLEAKAIPDSNGAIGIYSADPTLFGNISYGSNADQASVEKARVNGAKTNLIFGIPSPVIKTASGGEVGNARFELHGNQLSVVASGLSEISEPVTIDPSVVVTSTSDFQTAGNSEDNNIDFTTSGKISRAGLTGGSVTGSGWSSTTVFTTNRGQTTAVAYNGYLYVMGGESSSGALNDVQYAPINSSTGAVGTWTATTSFTTARYSANSFAYNGYLYLVGGTLDSNAPLNDVQYAPINSSTGAVGTWTATTSFTTARSFFATAVYGNYAYVIGGIDASNAQLATVQYAPINADGTVGSWTSTTSFTTARSSLQAVAYNGYLYMGGGYDGSTTYNDVQYAPINSSTGAVGTWTATTSFTTARSDFSFLVSGGYMYMLDGYAGGGVADVQYAPIKANGALGAWVATSSLTSARFDTGVAAYNGYLYVLGGYTSATTETNAVLVAKVDPAGQAQSWSTDSTHQLSAGRALNCVVAYNGYLYSIGGSTSDSSANNVTTVQSSAIASDGTLGTWSTLTALPAARGSAGCAAANGYLYVVGGYAGTGTADGAVLYDSITSSGTIGATWTTSSTDPTNLSSTYTPVHSGVFIYGNNIYSIGGDFSSGSGSGHTNGTFYAPINSDGSLGTWVSGTSLTASTYSARAYALIGSYLYAMGGIVSSSGTAQSAVEYAVINSDGSLGTWATTTSMPGVLADGGGAMVNGCLYVVGGENGAGTSQKTVYAACPNADGTIASGAWQTLPQLGTATTDAGTAGYNGYLYYIGGWTTSANRNPKWTAVNNGGSGSTGTWTTSAHTLTASREGVASVAYNGYLYALGGSDGTTYTATVEYASLAADGSIGTWQSASTMLLGRRYSGAVVNNGTLYIMGGDVGSPGTVTLSKETEYATINSNGSLGTWTASTNMPTSMYAFGTAIYNGYVYVTGGNPGGASAAVSYAPLTSGGIGTWQTGTSFTTARYAHATVAYDGVLYVIGGTTAANALLSDVQYAPINSDGSIGTWTFTSPIPARRYLSAMGANGHLYITGGTDTGTNAKSDVLIASISSNGALGSWMSTSAFTTSRFGAAAVYYNGYLYEVSGRHAASTYQNNVEYTPLNSAARIGHYSKLVDLGSVVNVQSITYSGTLPGGTSAITYRGAGSNALFTTSGAANTIAPTGQCTGNVSATRYLWVSVTLDDSTGAGSDGVFPDGNGTRAGLNDFTVNYTTYHPQPVNRMRNGLTVQNGVQGALDTCAS